MASRGRPVNIRKHRGWTLLAPNKGAKMRKLFGMALGAAALALSTLAIVQPASAG